jgi:plastocyanin
MTQRRTGLLGAVAGLSALALVAGACSGGSSDDRTGGGGPDADSGEIVPGSVRIGIVDSVFEPTTLTVASGSTGITVANADSVDHTFTLDDDSVDQPVAAGETVMVSVDLTESVGFHCEIHPAMTGTLQVS